MMDANVQSSAAAHYRRGIENRRQGRVQEAIRCFERSIELAPELPDAYASLGDLYMSRGNVSGMIRCFKKAFQLAPESAQGMLMLARALIEENSLEEAVHWINRLSALEPLSAEPHLMLGSVNQRLGKFEDAVSAFERARDLDPKRVDALFGIAYSRKITATDRPIVDALRALISVTNPNSGHARNLHYALGKALDDLGEYEQAIEHFDAANLIAEQLSAVMGNKFDRSAHLEKLEMIRSTFGREVFSAPPVTGSNSQKPIVIAGMPRSGTTLVEQILSSHSQVGAAGELMFWPMEGTRILSAEGIPNQASLGALERGYLSLLESASPAKRVTEKMPNNYVWLGLIHLVFPQARLIYCRRNPIANCLSIYMTPIRQGLNDRNDIVFVYQQHRRLMEHWREALPLGSLLEVEYEDLVANRERVTREMVEFCDLPWDEACLKHEANRASVRTPSVWQARQPTYNTSVDRWRNYEPWLGVFRDLA